MWPRCWLPSGSFTTRPPTPSDTPTLFHGQGHCPPPVPCRYPKPPPPEVNASTSRLPRATRPSCRPAAAERARPPRPRPIRPWNSPSTRLPPPWPKPCPPRLPRQAKAGMPARNVLRARLAVVPRPRPRSAALRHRPQVPHSRQQAPGPAPRGAPLKAAPRQPRCSARRLQAARPMPPPARCAQTPRWHPSPPHGTLAGTAPRAPRRRPTSCSCWTPTC